MRLIDADEIRKKSVPHTRGEHGWNAEIRKWAVLVGDIDDAPTVDAVEVVHGYWYEHHGITICSRCQAMFDTDLTMLQIPSTWKMPNYCPNCGAKMDGERKDNG